MEMPSPVLLRNTGFDLGRCARGGDGNSLLDNANVLWQITDDHADAEKEGEVHRLGIVGGFSAAMFQPRLVFKTTG